MEDADCKCGCILNGEKLAFQAGIGRFDPGHPLQNQTQIALPNSGDSMLYREKRGFLLGSSNRYLKDTTCTLTTVVQLAVTTGTISTIVVCG